MKATLGAKVVELDQKLSEAMQDCQELHESSVSGRWRARTNGPRVSRDYTFKRPQMAMKSALAEASEKLAEVSEER